jgi:hypothetical protein
MNDVDEPFHCAQNISPHTRALGKFPLSTCYISVIKEKNDAYQRPVGCRWRRAVPVIDGCRGQQEFAPVSCYMNTTNIEQRLDGDAWSTGCRFIVEGSGKKGNRGNVPVIDDAFLDHQLEVRTMTIEQRNKRIFTSNTSYCFLLVVSLISVVTSAFPVLRRNSVHFPPNCCIQPSLLCRSCSFQQLGTLSMQHRENCRPRGGIGGRTLSIATLGPYDLSVEMSFIGEEGDFYCERDLSCVSGPCILDLILVDGYESRGRVAQLLQAGWDMI